MKRLAGVSLAIALLGGLTFSHNVLSAPNPGKTKICHVTDEGAIAIEVADRAVPHHIAQHGDCTGTTADVGATCDPTQNDPEADPPDYSCKNP